ncbi:MFS transporter [Micromonospora sp. NPDC047557]|uniref:MFS transporter n=1 Tax=Micromonospora sp. NPDC047557 TaxID=3364250 RepID=UPI0037235307
MTAAVSAAADRFDTRQRLILVLLCGTQFMLALDFSILSVSLPVIGSDLKLPTSDLQWVVTAFALPSGGFLLLFGRAADMFGRRRLFLIGMTLFTVASLVGGIAPSAGWLFAARAGQGFGAAILTPAAMSLLTTSFEEGPRRNRALAVNGSLLSLGFLTGVVLGGVITDALGWRFTLLINLPLGVLALIGTVALIAESRQPQAPRLDLPGAVTVTGGLLGIVYGVTAAERNGWTSPTSFVPLIGGVVLLGAFLLIESRRRDPLIDLRVLRRRTVGWGNLTGLVTFSMVTGVVFLLTLYMQQVRGLTPFNTGLCFASLGVAAVLGGVVAPRILAKLGVSGTLITGLSLQAAGTLALVFLRTTDGIPLLLVATAVIGFGHLLSVVAYMITVTSGLPDEEQGLATGTAYTAQQVGLSIGTPIISSIAVARMDSLRATQAVPEALLGGVHLGVIVAGLVAVAAALVAVVFLRRPAEPATGLQDVVTTPAAGSATVS